MQLRLAAWFAVAALTLALPSAFVLHAESLSGRLTDPQGQAVADARLRLFDRTNGELRSTFSSAEGSYSFRNVPPGSYLLEAEAAGAALTASREVSLRGDQNLDVELGLATNAVEVVVTASGTPLSIHEVAKAVDVVDAEQMALRDEFALSEAIRNVPGLRVRQLGGPGSFTSVQTRGMRSSDTALLVDGLRFRDAAGTQGDATGLYQDVMIVDTERVEVLRGSGSSLYGSHAIGGALNVHSSQGGGRPHGEIRAEGGGLGLARGVARVGGGLAEDRFGYSGGFSHVNVSDGVRGGNPYRNTSAQGFAKYSFTPTVSLSGRLWASDGFAGLNESPAFPDSVTANFPAGGPVPAIALPDGELERFEQSQAFSAGNATFVPGQIDPDNHRASSFLVGAMIFQHQVTPGSSYRLAYQAVDSNRSFRDGPAGPGQFDPPISNDSQFDGRTDIFQARADHRAGEHNLLTFGYEFEREEYYNFNTDESSAPVTSEIDIEQNSHSLFAQDQIRVLDGNLQVALSGRAQFFRLKRPFFDGTQTPYDSAAADSPPGAYTGDAAVAYFFRGPQTKLRAHLGNSYRAPSAYERFGGSYSSFSSSFEFYGDSRLSPERAVGVDAGVDQWFLGSKARLSGTVFYTNLQQTVVFDFATFPAEGDPFGRFYGYRNGGGGISRGVEFSGQVSPVSSASIQASYTYVNADSRTPQIAPDYFSVLGTSSHVFTLTATQWIANRFNVTFDLFAAGDYSLSPFGALGRQMVFDGPLRADIVLRYNLPVGEEKSLELYSKIENLFDNTYYEDGFSTPGAWAVGGVRFRF